MKEVPKEKEPKARIEKKWEFIPSEEESWKSLELSENTVEKLAQCVQRAGLGDMEDAYLSIIPPLSNGAQASETCGGF